MESSNPRPVFKSTLVLIFLGFLGFSSNALSQPCVEDDTTLCLNKDRFKVKVEWLDEAGNEFTLPDLDLSGFGQAQEVNDDTGVFWFFGSEHHEVMIKVLDGCAVNTRFWVFADSTTNVEYRLSVTDTSTSQARVYTNPLGTIAPPITDTDAFNTCDGGSTKQATPINFTAISEPLIPSADPASCIPSATTMCMHGNRFAVTVDWRDFADITGPGQAINLGDQSGYFWFFAATNIELIINILDGTAKNGAFWVYFSATTNVEYTVTVTDTTTGAVRQYVNPLGQLSVVLDNEAFFDPMRFPEAPPVPVLTTLALGILAWLFAVAAWMTLRPARRRP